MRARPTPHIPNRLSFRIGDVSKLVGVEPYVLRFWESEFPMLQPKKSKTGHREYKRREVELILEIKRLLYKEGFTIPGARKALQDKTRSAHKKPATRPQPRPQPSTPPPRPVPSMAHVRKELREILSILNKRK